MESTHRSIARPFLNVLAWRPEIVMARGEGPYLYDRAGACYLDFMSGWGCSSVLGHGGADSLIVRVFEAQARRLIHPGPLFFHEEMIAFADELLSATHMDRVFFTSSGAEANENALKLVRKYGALCRKGAYEVITFTGGFHGRTLAMMSATAKASWQDLFEPKVGGFIHLPWGDLAAVEAVLKKRAAKIVAVMVEPIQGEAGVFPASLEFMRGLRDLTTQYELLLIADEIQTGMGRTGKLLASEHYGVTPDVLTLGKAVGGGFPLGVLLAREHCSLFASGDIGGTYTGQAMGMAVGRAVLREVLAPGRLDEITSLGELCKRRLVALSDAHDFEFSHIRGAGLMLAWDLREGTAPAVFAQALQGLQGQGDSPDSTVGEPRKDQVPNPKRLIINAVRPSSIRLLPPFIIKETDIDAAIRILGAAVASVYHTS